MRSLLYQFHVVFTSLLLAACRLSADTPNTQFQFTTNNTAKLTFGAVFDGTNYLVPIQGDSLFPNRTGNLIRQVGAQLVSPSGVLIGPLIDTGKNASPSTDDTPIPHAAFDGTNYLLVWTDSANAPNEDIYGQFISPVGNLVGSAFPITQAAGQQFVHGVVFDGNNYLVNWEDSRRGTNKYDVYGQFVSKAGTLVGGEIRISPTDNSNNYGNNAMANHENHQLVAGATNYFVVWTQGGPTTPPYETVVAGQFVSPNGNLVGSPIIIKPFDGFNIGDPSLPGIGFDGTNYMVCWHQDVSQSEHDLKGQRVSPAGNLVGGIVTLSTAPANASLPFLVFDGANYLVTWSESFNSVGQTCKARFVDPTGSPMSAEFMPFTPVGTNTAIVAAPIFDGKQFFVVAGLGSLAHDDGYGTFISPLPKGTIKVGIDGELIGRAASSGSNILVGLQQNLNIAVKLFSTNGTALTSQINIGNNFEIRGYPYVTFDNNNYLATWSDSTTNTGVTIFGQLISTTGTLVGSAIPLLSAQGSYGRQILEATAFGSTKHLIVWIDDNTGYLYGQLVTTAGTLSGSEFLISGQGGNADSAAVAFDGTNFLVIWQSYNNPMYLGYINTYGAYVSQNGVVSGIFQISQLTSTDYDPPAIAFDGTNYLVVWNRAIGPGFPAPPTWNLNARLVTKNGAFAGNEITLVTDQPLFPSLVFNGTNYLLSYSHDLDTMNTDKAIRYRFLNRQGNLVGSEFTLFGAQGDQLPMIGGVGTCGTKLFALSSLGTVVLDQYGFFLDFFSADVYALLLDPASFTNVLANVSAPNITQQPRSQSVAIGDTISLNVRATGSEPLTYQWRLNGTNLIGATSPTLSIPGAQANNAGTYTVVVANYLDTVTSAPATVSILNPPSIDGGPGNTSASVGDHVIFSVTADGDGILSYQWRLNGVNIPNATNSTYEIPSVQLADAGAYTIVVANAVGSQISSVAKLLLNVGPSVLTDVFANRVITNNTSNGEIQGNNINATKEIGEPNHAGNAGGKSVWFGWTAPANGLITFTTSGSGFDTLLAVYTGTAVNNLTSVISDDDFNDYFTSSVTFFATSGTTYQIAVDGFGGASGDIELEWEFEIGPDEGLKFVTQPQSQTVTNGATVQFSATVQGGNLSHFVYQWFLNNQAIPNANSTTLQVANVQTEQVGSYQLIASNTHNSTIYGSTKAILEIGAVAGLQTADKFESLFNGGGALSGFATSQRSKSAFVTLTAGTLGTQIFDNFGATTQLGEPSICGVIGGVSRWFSIEAADDGIMTVDTIGSDFDTVLGVYTGTSLSTLTLVACDNDSAPDGIRSTVTFTAVKGTTYAVAVDGVNGAQGTIALNWKLGTPPQIAQPPNSQTVTSGGSVTLSASATGVPAPAYQWQFNGSDIYGETNATLTVNNFQQANRGSYSVVASNIVGTAASTSAFVALDVPAHFGALSRNSGGLWQLQLTGVERQSYVVQTATNLLSSGTIWTPLSTNSSFDGVLNFLDNPGSNTNRFYRAIKQN